MALILIAAAIIATVAFSQQLRVAHQHVLGLESAPIGQKANAGKERILAMMVDNFAAFVLAFVAVKLLPPKGPVASGIAFSLSYLGYFFVSESVWGRTLGK